MASNSDLIRKFIAINNSNMDDDKRQISKKKQLMNILIPFKKLDKDAVIPTRAYKYDAGWDLTAIKKETDEYGNTVYHTGIAVQIPNGFVGLLFPRSSVCKQDQILTNCVGVIDSGYRGEILLKFANVKSAKNEYKLFERVGQLVIFALPKVTLKEVDELMPSERGTNGYGSSN